MIQTMRRSLLLIAFVAFAAASAQAQDCDCTASIEGPKAGQHSGALAGSGGIDVVLWPPNHKLHEVAISAVDSDGEPCDVEIVSVSQDEAVDAPGSGNTIGADAENCSNDGDTSTVDLRAERSGLGNGRFYDIEYTMEDNEMMPGTCTDQHAIALVPHDQRRDQSGWADDGLQLTSGVVCTPGMM